MINFKEKKGITLVALVITIIVLLILAGIALSLVLGENGITERAVNAGKIQNIAGAKEKLELEVANLASEFYQAKYVNGNVSANTVGEYVLSKLSENYPTGNFCDGYKVTVDGSSVTLKATTGSDRTTETATISDDGKVIWNGITTASANPCTVSFYSDQELTNLITTKTVDSGETIGASMPEAPTKEPDETYTYTFAGWKKSTDNSNFTGSTVVSGNISVYADWTAEVPPVTVSSLTTDEYGDYFDLGTQILGTVTNGTYSSSNQLEGESTTIKQDWRIFSKDSDGVWLILADYYPASSNSSFITSTIGLSLASNTSTYPYGVRSTSNRADLMTRLRNDWKGILPSSLQSNTNVTAVGALTVTEWQAGWNSKYSGSEQITISGDETNGFDYTNINSKEGYSNTLYFPHKSIPSNCYGYWLASPRASSTNNVMYVYYYGSVNRNNYNSGYYGVRPAVHLASGINIEQNSTTGIWTISN